MIPFWWITSLAASAFATSSADKCVCQPGQDCWPASSDWEAFNQTDVGGRLVAIHPVATSCHDPTYDKQMCQAIVAEYTNSTWRSDQIGKYTWKY